MTGNGMAGHATRAGIVIAAGLACLFAAIAVFRPLMPVDETRYLSVAWEMRVQGNWILPTLNFEPYSHKPPLLFWLVRASWEVFGVGITAARIVILMVMGALFYMTGRMARLMHPRAPLAQGYAMLVLAAMPMFLVYASMIMFDALLALCAALGLVAILRAARGDGIMRFFLLLGGAMGLGILAKGPVAFVYMLPAALLAPLWVAPGAAPSWGRWYGGVAMAAGVAAAIGLAWAVPAAMAGGPVYAQKIFITQSAGRMIDAFDHVEPFWFYLPILAAFLLPLLVWPQLWRALRQRDEDGRNGGLRFALCAAVPVFVFFSLISSKQVHYLLPALPVMAAAAGGALARGGVTRLPVAALGLLFVPSAVVAVCAIFELPFIGVVPPYAAVGLAALHGAAAAAIAVWARRDAACRAVPAVAMAAFVLAVMAHAQMGQRFLPRYDLTALADAARPVLEAGRPLGAAPKNDGEYNFILRTTRPIPTVDREHTAPWFAANPDGVLIGRYKFDRLPLGHDITFIKSFRIEEALILMEAREP